MPRLFLHIGTHKTGTTSIQRFCASNRDALRRAGVWYPNTDLGVFRPHYAHHHLAHAIAGRDPEHGIDDVKSFFSKLRSKASDDEVCLISAEPMYRHALAGTSDSGRTGAAATANREAEMARYSRAVADCLDGFDVTVLVMLRRQDLFVESLYAEQVLSTGYVRPIERFVRERAHLLDYELRLATWAESFGSDRISVKVFERSSLTAPIEQVFLEWLGVPFTDDFEIGRRHNVTPTRALVEFKRLVNDPKQPGPVGQQLRRWVERIAADADRDELPDIGKYFLSPRARARLLLDAEPGNARVAERYLGRRELFTDPLVDVLADYEDSRNLTEGEFQMIAAQTLRIAASDALRNS